MHTCLVIKKDGRSFAPVSGCLCGKKGILPLTKKDLNEEAIESRSLSRIETKWMTTSRKRHVRVCLSFGNAPMNLDYKMSNMTSNPQRHKQKARQIGIARVNQICKRK